VFTEAVAARWGSAEQHRMLGRQKRLGPSEDWLVVRSGSVVGQQPRSATEDGVADEVGAVELGSGEHWAATLLGW